MITITKNSPEWKTLFGRPDTADFLKASNIETLFAEGDLTALLNPARPKVILTGARDIRENEIPAIRAVMEKLAQNPWHPVIVSGLAVGTDTFVHRYALELGLATIAVTANGLDTVYPFMNRELAGQIQSTKDCALLTPFPEGTAPLATNFLARNRLMALLSDAAVILYSKSKGSSILSARLMADLEKPVWALPGRINDINAAGCNQLIREGSALILSDLSDLDNIIGTPILKK